MTIWQKKPQKNEIQINDEQAQGMVEFALVMPILLLLVMGIFTFGHFFFVYIMNVSASREAVRYGVATGNSEAGIARYRDCSSIRAAAKRIGAPIGLDDGMIEIEYDNGPGTAVFATCPVGGLGPSMNLGDRIIVRTTITYDPFFPLVNLPSFPLSAESARSVIKDIYVGTAAPIAGGPGGSTATSTQIVGSTATPTATQQATATVTSTNTQIVAVTPTPEICTGSGTIYWEYYKNIKGDSIADLTGDAAFPDSPWSTDYLTELQGPEDYANKYGSRMRGYLCAPYDGAYTFWIASNNYGDLYFSSDSDPANKSRIAYVVGWTNSREWYKYASQQSSPINLVAGNLYYIEVLHKEDSEWDSVAVGWTGPYLPASPTVIDGQYLVPAVP